MSGGGRPVVETAHGTTRSTARDTDAGTAATAARPGLLVCLGLLERTDDPVALLLRLADVAGGGPVLVATPDRSVSDPDRPAGPPTRSEHRREWSYDQFELLLLSTGFEVERSWHVPPAGSPWSALRSVLDRRSCMVFLARSQAR